MAPEVQTAHTEAPAVPAQEATPALPPCRSLPLSHVDVVLRILLFVASLVAVVGMFTSKQTKNIYVVQYKIQVLKSAKFQNSPAFIYLVVALSVSGLYSIITTLASISIIMKPQYSTKFIIQFAIWDVIMLGIVASATGTAGGVAYIGMKGNNHVQWSKICNIYDKYCLHTGVSILFSLIASIILILLIAISVVSLYKKIPK
ncbi:CASP-like protein 1D1 [Rutidosis leptorrhynchoides]|uniref:CASP-like protein 1D1 n=1 Tax=Rutidosis leptorrhynchoides TaxID=125765 RepID=UPI003A9A2EAA